MLWKRQLHTAIVAGGYEDFINGRSVAPAQYLDASMHTLNDDYKQWQRTDKSVMSLLYSSPSSEPLGQVVNCQTSFEVWETLRQRYESNSTTRIINLRTQMQQLRKDGLTMPQYLASLKSFSDQLAAIGEPVKYKDYFWYMLEGLPAEYDAIVTAIYSRLDQPSVDEVQNLLLNFDLRLEKRQVSDRVIPQVQYTSLRSSASGYQQPQPPHSPNQPTTRPITKPWIRTNANSSILRRFSDKPPAYSQQNKWPNRNTLHKPKPKCQICFKLGHTAASCYHRLNPSYQPQMNFTHIQTPPTSYSQPASHPARIQTTPTSYSQPLTNPFSSSYDQPTQIIPSPEDWLIDSGATHYVTSRVDDLQFVTPYQGQSTVIVGNGNVILISHVGYKSISRHPSPLHLNNVLCVPKISNRLISVSKLYSDNNAFVEFHPDCFCVKTKHPSAYFSKGQCNRVSIMSELQQSPLPCHSQVILWMPLSI
ncbi:Protein kinase domain-containing protein [Psidium guajava]|nr:Protein kinase domain-containing protein [Psidium guajava]